MAELKFEPFSGVSGDMIVAALMELADAEKEICALPEILKLPAVEVSSKLVIKNGIESRKVDFVDHTEEQGGHHHHRHLRHIHEILDNSTLTPSTIEIAKGIFLHLAEAEASVHGSTIEKVHFHEVGAIDSIFDITAAAYLIDQLGITKTYTDPVCTGFGFVMTDHGKMPVPAPATQKLLEGIPSYAGDVESEMSTPTGAAILRYLKPVTKASALTTTKTGYGAGTKDFEQPNLLRLSLCNSDNAEELILLQTNIDDMNAEFIGAAFISDCLEQGALDAYLTPLVMKKGRPGAKLEVLCSKEIQEKLSHYIMQNTSSIGVRSINIQREILDRKAVAIEGSFGSVVAKQVILPSGKTRLYPEYESCKAIAEAHKLSPYDVYLDALASTKA